MDELTRKRLEHNEEVFRSLNEEIDELRGGGVTEYVCECADTGCTARVALSGAEYRSARVRPHRFVVLAGHERPELEEVVGRGDGWLLVEKR